LAAETKKIRETSWTDSSAPKAPVKSKPPISKEEFQKMTDSDEYFIRTVRTPEKDLAGRTSTPAGKIGIELGLSSDTHKGLSGFNLKDQKRMLEWMGKEGWEHENVAVYKGKPTKEQVTLDPGEVEFNPDELVGYIPTKSFKEHGGDFHAALVKNFPESPQVVGESKVKRLSQIREEAAVAEKVTTQPKVKRLAQIREESALKSEVKPVESEVEDLIKTKEPRLRDKVYNLLDEQEKAARARLAAKKNTLSSLPLDQYADHAVILAAKIGKGGIKLADATEYLVKEFGESIRPHAQAILARSREVVRVAERRATKEGLEAEAFNNSGLGDSKSFESKITRGKKSDKKTFGERWEKLKTQFTEDIAPLNKLERDVTGKISSAESSFYKSARMYKGVPEKINQFIDQRLKPIVRGIEKLGFHSDDLGRYALAVHAKDVNKAGMKSGFTNAEIDDVISKFGTAEMEKARKELVNINKELLDDLVDSGVVSSDLRNALNERWKNYIPLHRDLDDVVGRSSGLSEALANVASPIKRLKGSERNVIEPLENMVENIVKNINAVERNKVASHITKLSKLDPDENFIRKIKDGEKTEGKNVVSVKINGENVHYEVEPEVMKAILTLDKETGEWLGRFLAVPASWLRAGATLTPEFIIRNPIRDYRNARIVSESGFRLTDYAVGLASSIMGKFGKGKLYQDWVKNLGAYGNIVSEDRNVFLASQKKVLTQSATKKFVNVINPKNIITLLRSISDISESSTKVGEYRAALRKGATKEEAAYRSRDIMDFARSGTSIRQTNKIVAFLNANIQGKSKMIRAFKKNPVGTSVRIFKSMAVPTAGIYYYNKHFANDEQKDTIKNAPNWQKNTFWLVAVPGTDMVARIPKPFDFAVVANVVERSLEFFDDNDKEAFDNFGKGVITDNTIPMMITGLLPLIEGMGNHSFFKDGPIIPVRDQGVEFKDQYDPIRTSETAKGIAKVVGSIPGGLGGNFRSPYVIDNTIQGLFAGGGKYATDAIDAILGGLGAANRPKAPEKSAEQKPVLRSFLVDPNQGGTAMDQIYTLKDKLTKEEGSAKRREEDYKDSDKLDYVTAQTKEMSLIGAAIRSYEKSMDLSPKQKREKIDDLNKQRNDIAKTTLKRIKEVDGK